MSRKRALIAILFVATAALGDEVVSGLARNAWYWQARARSDKAEEAWKQVLEAAPDQPDALAAVGGFAARAGRLDEARKDLARLEKASPGHPDVPVLRRQIQLGTSAGPLLSQARKLVHEDHAAEGAAKYRELFGDAGPPGDLALEYYQTIGGAPGGWQEARDGLRRLTRRAPAEARYRLTLAKLLSYHEDTRREAIAMLSALARDPAVGGEAQAGWRQALLWLVPGDRDLPLLRAWQKGHPGDTEVARHIEHARTAGTLKEGFASLDRGDLRSAEQRFRSAGEDPDARRGLSLIAGRRLAEIKKAGFAALQQGELERARQLFRSAGDDADARLGLALVDQKEALLAMSSQDFPRARALLENARQLAPSRRDVWEAPLQSAVFWQRMRDARQARAAGREPEAEALYQQAGEAAPKAERWQVDLALGDLYLARKDARAAEARYREVLAAVADQPEALRALAVLLVRQQRFQEVLPINDRLARAAPGRAFSQGWLQAERLRSEAWRASAAQDFDSARKKLQEARQQDPSNLWVLHDLAGVLLQQGATGEAQPLVAELLRAAPELPEARTLQARLLVAQGRDAEALEVLSSVPSRDAAVLALRRRLEVQVRIPQLLALADSGQRADAEAELAALERDAGGEPDLAARLALAWSKLGASGRAVQLMQDAIAKAPLAARGARLQLAGALLQAGDDAQAARLLEGLERGAQLTQEELRSLGNLRVALAVRKADRLRAQGDVPGALTELASALQQAPGDARLLSAQARTLEPSDGSRAHALYLEVLRAMPGDQDALRGAADTTGDVDEAHSLAAEAVRLHPEDPRAWELLGRTEERALDDGAAMSAYQRALRIEDTPVWASLQPGISGAPLGEGKPQAAAAVPDPLRQQLARDMQRVQDRHRPAVDGGFELRQRSGEPGLSQLSELRESIEAMAPLGYSARATLRITEVQVDPGDLAAAAAPRFGSGGSISASPGGLAGTELQAAFESKHVVANLGTTPLGFPIFWLLGGAGLRASAGPFSIAAGVSRRSVNDSLLSWGGATDPRSGSHFGGVVLDSARVDLGLSGSLGSLYGYAEGGRMIGLRVADNQRGAAGVGASLSLYDGDLGQIGAGPTASLAAYQRNLRFFTLGHGGYFSPQRFLHGGLAVRWRHNGALRWDVRAEPGYDFYEEAHEAVFPLSPDGQLYPGRSSGGASFNGSAFLGVGITRDLELGFTAAAQRAPEFQEVRAGVSLRFGGH